MKRLGVTLVLLACLPALCSAQEATDFRPASTNVWDAQYPRVDSKGRVEVRLKAPDATKVRVNFWSGPKVDMVKQADGFWTVITAPLVPGLHYYTLIVDSVEIADTGSRAFFGGGKYASAVEVPEPGSAYYSIHNVPHGQVREVWYFSKVTGRGGTRWSTCRPVTTRRGPTVSGALPAARRRRRRDRLDPAGARQLHPR